MDSYARKDYFCSALTSTFRRALRLEEVWKLFASNRASSSKTVHDLLWAWTAFWKVILDRNLCVIMILKLIVIPITQAKRIGARQNTQKNSPLPSFGNNAHYLCAINYYVRNKPHGIRYQLDIF